VKKVILVLEDDKSTRESISSVFNQQGYEVIETSSVPEAIIAVRSKHIDLAIVDIKMPIVDGYKFCDFLRGIDKYSRIPIVVVTAEEKRYGKEKAQSLKIEAFIEKPFALPDLVAKVKQIFEKFPEK